jgi:5-methylthioribose kinase
MLELTPDNAGEYLQRRGWLPPGQVRITELADGVSNAVLRVEAGAVRFVLKQSRPRLRTREAWFSDVARVWRERDVLRELRPLLPPGTVPDLLFEDPDNFTFAMSHVPEPLRNWRSVLLAGEIDEKLGEQAGWLLGMIHRRTGPTLEHFSDRTVFEQLRVEPFYLRIQQRLPDISSQIEPLIQRCRTLRLGLCHGDFSPKNLLLHAGGFTLVDHETAHAGDIAFDLGFFLSHLVLKSIHLPQRLGEFQVLMSAFQRGYLAEAGPAAQEVMIPGMQHLGACLLARIDGTSPVPYLSDEAARQRARRIGRSLLRQPPRTWSEMLQITTGGS